MDVRPESVIAAETIRPLRRVEFERLVSEGHFDDERVELLFGVLVPMSPVDPAHEEAAHRIAEILRRQLGTRASVRENNAFAASEISEPVPDVAVVPAGSYWTAHPDRSYLVVEVARTSLPKDRGTKARLYADGSVAEYWIVNHVDDCIEVFRTRRDGAWRTHARLRRGEVVRMVRYPDVTVMVDDVLPPRRRRSPRRTARPRRKP
jgi:Uma2 family endonuclease